MQTLKSWGKSCRIQPALCGKVNSAIYQMILKEKIWPSLRKLKLKGTRVTQRDTDPKQVHRSAASKMTKWRLWSPSVDLTPTGMRWGDRRSSSKTLQCGHVKRLVWGRLGQNSSAAIGKAHWQLTQMLDCSYCGRGWHNRWLSAGGNYAFTKGVKSSRRNCILYWRSLSLSDITISVMMWNEKNAQGRQIRKEEKKCV